ncbi:MAG TPA: hypothetical protein VFD70_18620 [Anaerolineae bacterium]|nr:hypothetical protein [Anaerolineae bacterium]
MNAPAMKDGRSRLPPLPEETRWIQLTRAVNLYLQASYTIEQVQFMPSDQLTVIEALMESP